MDNLRFFFYCSIILQSYFFLLKEQTFALCFHITKILNCHANIRKVDIKLILYRLIVSF